MKIIVTLLISILSLNAGIFSTYIPQKEHASVIKKFRKTVSDGNAIVKKGDYNRYETYQTQTESILTKVDSFDLSPKEKTALKNNLKSYSQLIALVYKNIKVNTPDIHLNYENSLSGLVSFNNIIESTGYAPLLKEWYDLSKVKYKYIKKPSARLKKEFDKKLRAVELILEDLCLDEELEDPLLAYLETYKTYMRELNLVYTNVEYSNIHKIKPLSYIIKSKLEFVGEM